MRVRVLGCSGAIAKDCRTTSFLLDGDVLVDAGAICECEEHGWMKDRADRCQGSRPRRRQAGSTSWLDPG